MAKITKAIRATYFDSYTRYARIAPVFIVLLPLGISVAVWFPGEDILAKMSIMTLAPVLLAVLAAQFGRHWGKEKEKSLWQSWGGAPTTQFLRHRDTTFNPIIRARCHKKLQELLPDCAMPSSEMEERNPRRADQVYEVCTRFLRTQTRDKKRFPLVYKENIQYGFLRNLWGMKWLGLTFVLIGLIACGIRAWSIWEKLESIPLELVVGSLLCLACSVLWIFWISPDTIRIAANAYAERLLETCEQLERKE